MSGPALNVNEQFYAGQSGLRPDMFPTPTLPPPDPTLGDRMRNRDWFGRQQELAYQLRSAPTPYQVTRDRPHPLWGGGAPTALAQRIAPQGPPVGMPARGMNQSALDAYTAPRPRGGWMVPYNAPYNPLSRVVGRGQMTPYAWPIQGYPQGSNTYIPVWEATGLIVKYTRDPQYFRLNKYVKDIKIPKDTGYYLTLDGEQPYRVVAINDYLWVDSADAPGGRQERQGFGFQNYRTARYCFPFTLGKKSVEQAEWPILAEHARMSACKAMTVRTLLNTTLATTSTNWVWAGNNNFGAVSGVWGTSSETDLFIYTDIANSLITVEQSSGGIVSDEEALQITMNPTFARRIAKSPELRAYLKGSPDAISVITDLRNPNRRYGLAPWLYGIGLVVENAIVVTTPKSANSGTTAAQTRSYIWPTASVVISSRPNGITQEGGQALDFSTFCMRFYEQMTTESKSDPDNRREVGRVVEDYIATLQAPQTGFLLTGAS